MFGHKPSSGFPLVFFPVLLHAFLFLSIFIASIVQAVVGSIVWCSDSSRFYRVVSRQYSALSSVAQAIVGSIVCCPGSSRLYRLVPRQ